MLFNKQHVILKHHRIRVNDTVYWIENVNNINYKYIGIVQSYNKGLAEVICPNIDNKVHTVSIRQLHKIIR